MPFICENLYRWLGWVESKQRRVWNTETWATSRSTWRSGPTCLWHRNDSVLPTGLTMRPYTSSDWLWRGKYVNFEALRFRTSPHSRRKLSHCINSVSLIDWYIYCCKIQQREMVGLASHCRVGGGRQATTPGPAAGLTCTGRVAYTYMTLRRHSHPFGPHCLKHNKS